MPVIWTHTNCAPVVKQCGSKDGNCDKKKLGKSPFSLGLPSWMSQTVATHHGSQLSLHNNELKCPIVLPLEIPPPASEDIINPRSGSIYLIPDMWNFKGLKQNNILRDNIRLELCV